MSPYELPANANMMGMKSNSTKGGGYNEIVIVDGKADELIRIHAQKDLHTTVEHDDYQIVKNNRVIEVYGTHTETIKKDMTTVVTEGNQTNTVKAGSSTNTAAIKNIMAVGSGEPSGTLFGSITMKDDGTLDVTSTNKISLHVGGSSITIEAGKIIIVSPDIELNP